jgi:hypothetical protein
MTARTILPVILFLAFAATVSGQAPVPVVERTVTQGDVATRVSLFSNRVVVVTTRRDGEQDFMRTMTLPNDQYMVYLTTFQANAEELDDRPISSRVDTSQAEVVLSLYVGPDAPRLISFSPMSSVTLPLARILGALDDLQLQAFEASPSAEAMRIWEPRKGDRVELLNGIFATVVEVWDDGLIILEHDGTYVRESISPGMRDQVILRVVEPIP